MLVSEIRVKQIRVNQGLGVFTIGPALSCIFKQLKVYITRLSIKNQIVAWFLT